MGRTTTNDIINYIRKGGRAREAETIHEAEVNRDLRFLFPPQRNDDWKMYQVREQPKFHISEPHIIVQADN